MRPPEGDKFLSLRQGQTGTNKFQPCVEIPTDVERDVVRWDEFDRLFKFNDEWRRNGSRRAIDWWNYEWWFAGVEFEVEAFKEVITYFRWFYILAMDDYDAAPALVGGGAAMLVDDGDETVWSEAVCDAARSVESCPSLLSRQKMSRVPPIGCPG